MRLLPCLFAAALMAGETEMVPLHLEPVRDGLVYCQAAVELGPQGACAFPFNWADGWLRCQRIGQTVRYDRSGDGRIDEADGPPVAMGNDIELRLPGYDGPYLLSFSFWDDSHLRIQSSSAAVGDFQGRRIVLYDRSVGGRFDVLRGTQLSYGDDGADRVRGRASASMLMPVMAFSGQLYEVEASSRSLKLTPWSGPVTRLRLEVSDGPNPLHLPTIRGAEVELWKTDGSMSATVVSGVETVLASGDYLVTSEYLGLVAGKPEQHPYLFREGGWKPMHLDAGAQRLVRQLPERLELRGCVLDATTLELDSPALVCGDGRAYIAKLYGISSGDGPESPLTFHVEAGGRRSPIVKMEYG